MAIKSPSTQPLILELYTASHCEGSLSIRGVKLERLIVADVALASTVRPKRAARSVEKPIVRLPWNVVFSGMWIGAGPPRVVGNSDVWLPLTRRAIRSSNVCVYANCDSNGWGLNEWGD